jgi:hypothetical protein
MHQILFIGHVKTAKVLPFIEKCQNVTKNEWKIGISLAVELSLTG